MNANPAIKEAIDRANKMGLISEEIYRREILPYIDTVFVKINI